MYLPGTTDQRYRLNVRTIFHGPGFEGNWFRAMSAWQRAVAPLIGGSEQR